MKELPLWETKDFGSVRKIYLMLGPACNMHCRHCLQTPTKSLNYGKPKISSKMWDLIEHFVEHGMRVDNVGVKMSNKRIRKKGHCIVLWGGEPLLYWDIIKEIVERTNEKFYWLGTGKISFMFVTNGKLLTQEIVDFCNYYHVQVGFSYDAPYPFAVRDYISDEICELVQKLNFCEVYCNPCSYNMDTLLSMRCIIAKFPKFKEMFLGSPFIFKRTFPMPEELYKVDWDEMRYILKKIRIASQLDDENALTIIGKHIFNAMVEEGHKSFPEVWKPGCMSGWKEIQLALDGTVSLCHNKLVPIGTIDDTLSKIYDTSFNLLNTVYKNPDCEACEHRDICRGICPIELRDNRGCSVTCNDFRKEFLRLAKEEMSNLLRKPTEEEIAWYREQEKIMDKQVEMFLKEGQRYKEEGTPLPKEIWEKVCEKQTLVDKEK